MNGGDPTPFDDWLQAYGAAWEARDPAAAALLFTDEAEYFWTPFQEPKRGPAEIAEAWGGATTRQREVRFRYTVLSFANRRGVAHWHTDLVRAGAGHRVSIDGVLLAELTSDGRCRLFREWWHSTELEG